MNKNDSKVVYIVGTSIDYNKLFLNRGYCVSIDKTHKPDLVCFTGGADVDPQLYGEDALSVTMVDPGRDTRDIEVWDKWNDVPKVGICRGGQFLNVMSGGAMWQHVENHGLSYNHILKNLLKINDTLKKFDEVPVTSTHHQMMIAGEGGEVIGIATDETGKKGRSNVYLSSNPKRTPPEFDTEVVWYEKTKSLCFQPHPELFRAGEEHRNYFFALIDYLIWEKN